MLGRNVLFATLLAAAIAAPSARAQRADSVTVVTVPDGADVFEADGGVLLGTAPIAVPRPGRALRLRISAAGHTDEVIVVAPDAPARLEVRLAPGPSASPPPSSAAPEGVDLVTDPAGAEVYDAEGRLLGNCPFRVLRSALPMRLVLRAPGRQDRTLRLSGRSPAEVRVRLRPSARSRRETAATPTPIPAPAPSGGSGSAFHGPNGMWSCTHGSRRCGIGPGVVGMTERQVIAALGEPGERREDQWYYSYHARGGLHGSRTTVFLRFRRGRVVEASASNMDLADIVSP